ncbi:hypothetical protein NQ317_019461 [Molorchus minor]|uniref:Reverse transcriptase domain-containing protein n=1 Tax=Molorchus minor TaxID=1323400 RepID=A0ABQ9IQR2_9CUCU|nr:hypothetical protein NQ317_019461 [Molorchus minor]
MAGTCPPLAQVSSLSCNDKGAIPKDQKEKLLCYLGDSAKILADLAYHSSQLRRTLILPQMDKSVREMAETTSPGIYLFGDDFGGKRKFKQEAPGPSAEGGEATEGLLLKTKPQQPIPEQPLKGPYVRILLFTVRSIIGTLLLHKTVKTSYGATQSEAISCVNYLDDFILFGDTAEQCDKHTKFAIRLLTRLGFIINYEKSSLVPARNKNFLGFNFDSQQQRLNLPNEKRLMILKQTHALQVEPFCKIRDLARVLGLLVSACPAVRYGWLYTKTLERDKYLALQKSNANYDAKMQISSLGKSDLNWWEKNILTTYNTIQTDSYDIEIFTDSSLTGWGAVCQGQSTHGWWTTLDKKEHINVLELKKPYFTA